MKKSLVIIFFLAIIIYLSSEYFFNKNFIKIGYVAGLSGKYSNLGHSILDGFNLAFSEINYEIRNNQIQIIIRDDMQKDEVARDNINNFIKEDVHLIVGNATSSMTKISLSALSKYKDTFLFSPSASSSEFSNIDDNFLRVQVAHSKDRFNLLSKYLVKNNFLNNYILYDSKNKSYSNNYLNNFKDSLISFGGKEYVGISPINKNYNEILADIKSKKDLDVITIVANSIDTSKLIQFLRINNIKQQIVVSGWAKNETLLEDSGKALDGTIILTTYDSDSKNKSYKDFVKRFQSRYGYTPSVFSAQGYEAAKVIIEVLNKDSNLKDFKTNLLKHEKFKGLQGEIIFNKYGDVQRETFLTKVVNNKFEKIDFSLK